MKFMFMVCCFLLAGYGIWRFTSVRQSAPSVALTAALPPPPQDIAAVGERQSSGYKMSTSGGVRLSAPTTPQNIYYEPFIMLVGTNCVMTDCDLYWSGEQCKKGTVLRVTPRIVYVRGFDARPIVILHDDDAARQRRNGLVPAGSVIVPRGTIPEKGQKSQL